MSDAQQQIIMEQCQKFLTTISENGLLVFSYQDGQQVRIVRTKKGIHVRAELQLLLLAMTQAIEEIPLPESGPERA